MSDSVHDWIVFDGGRTLGKTGSENGVILADEEYGSRARITLEKDGSVAPLAITCGLYGLMVHTRFFATEHEAHSQMVGMKVELARLVDCGANEAAVEAFVERFPG